MKQIGILWIAFVMALFLTGCKASQVVTESGTVSAKSTQKEGGYSILYNTVKIDINAPAAPIIEALGKPLSYFEAPSCAFQGVDKTYTYSGLQLLTYPDKDTDYVYKIVLMDDTVSTQEGVSLGEPLSRMTASYGDDCQKENDMYTYTKGDSTLSFLLEDGVITSIEYKAVTKE